MLRMGLVVQSCSLVGILSPMEGLGHPLKPIAKDSQSLAVDTTIKTISNPTQGLEVSHALTLNLPMPR